MLAIASRQMGFKIVQWVGGPDSGPAGIADEVIESSFDCRESLERFLDLSDVVTVEFENIPSSLLREIEERSLLHPSARAIETAQHREREKTFLVENRIPCAPFVAVSSADELEKANRDLSGDKRILKTAEFGYDGKGQVGVDRGDDTNRIWSEFPSSRALLEQRIDLAGELSILIARNSSGDVKIYPAAENIHVNGILHLSIVPARFPETILDLAREKARELARHLDYVGILAVEFFVSSDGELFVNEMAPRPHNSGHHTLDSCCTSQFEQQLRAICDLPLGSTDLHSPTVMLNLLGDVWPASSSPDWESVLSVPGAHLHLYGKREARPGRKMGHINFTGQDLEALVFQAEEMFARLQDRVEG